MPKEKLRNFGKFLKFYLIAAIGAIVLLSSCDRLGIGPNNYDTAEDSVWVAQVVTKQLTPEFTDVISILNYQDNLVDEESVKNLFLSLPTETIENVATVLLKKKSSITIRDVITEYMRCDDIYNNLPTKSEQLVTDTTKSSVDLGATDLGNRQDDSNIISTSYKTRHDTVNGKPRKVIIKTEERYE